MEAGTSSDHVIESVAQSLILNSFFSSPVKTQTQVLALLGHLLPINTRPVLAVSEMEFFPSGLGVVPLALYTHRL